MTPKEARAILVAMCGHDGVGADLIYGHGLLAGALHGEVQLDREVTPDQLEAIAMWMRDPKGVVDAA